jgi:hypothetical protein
MVHPDFDNLKGYERAAAWKAMSPSEQDWWKRQQMRAESAPQVIANPNLRSCRDCGKDVSVNADACPHYGAKRKQGKSVLEFVFLVVFLLPVAFGTAFMAWFLVLAALGGFGYLSTNSLR